MEQQLAYEGKVSSPKTFCSLKLNLLLGRKKYILNALKQSERMENKILGFFLQRKSEKVIAHKNSLTPVSPHRRPLSTSPMIQQITLTRIVLGMSSLRARKATWRPVVTWMNSSKSGIPSILAITSSV